MQLDTPAGLHQQKGEGAPHGHFSCLGAHLRLFVPLLLNLLHSSRACWDCNGPCGEHWGAITLPCMSPMHSPGRHRDFAQKPLCRLKTTQKTTATRHVSHMLRCRGPKWCPVNAWSFAMSAWKARLLELWPISGHGGLPRVGVAESAKLIRTGCC
jgi:hypothetical protein